MTNVGFLSVHAVMKTAVVMFLFLISFCFYVDCKPASDSFFKTNFDLNKLGDVVEGRSFSEKTDTCNFASYPRDWKISFSREGIDFDEGMTIEEKLLYIGVAAAAVIILAFFCVCCCACCCRNNVQRPATVPSTNIIYSPAPILPHNGHNMTVAPISSVAAAAGWTPECPPPPYASVVSSPSSFKKN